MQAVGTKNRTSLHSIDGSAFKTRGSLSIGKMIEDETTGDSQLKREYYYKRIKLNSNRELVFTAGDATIFSVDMSQAYRYVQG